VKAQRDLSLQELRRHTCEDTAITPISLLGHLGDIARGKPPGTRERTAVPMKKLIAQVPQNRFHHVDAIVVHGIVILDHPLLIEYNHQGLMTTKPTDERESYLHTIRVNYPVVITNMNRYKNLALRKKVNTSCPAHHVGVAVHRAGMYQLG
jgi:hypothetical protein